MRRCKGAIATDGNATIGFRAPSSFSGGSAGNMRAIATPIGAITTATIRRCQRRLTAAWANAPPTTDPRIDPTLQRPWHRLMIRRPICAWMRVASTLTARSLTTYVAPMRKSAEKSEAVFQAQPGSAKVTQYAGHATIRTPRAL